MSRLVPAELTGSNVQLTGAVEKAKKARRKRWICFWIIIIICLAIALAVGLGVGLNRAANSGSGN